MRLIRVKLAISIQRKLLASKGPNTAPKIVLVTGGYSVELNQGVPLKGGPIFVLARDLTVNQALQNP